jgi:hypothetical protein
MKIIKVQTSWTKYLEYPKKKINQMRLDLEEIFPPIK